MSIIVTGALAFDHIMTFPDKFKNHIMPEKIHVLNVSFAVDSFKRNYGGNAGNIAYGIKMLGSEPIIISAIGKDGKEYLQYLTALGIRTNNIVVNTKLNTASCFITTDLDDNQITAFYKGASTSNIKTINTGNNPHTISVAIIAPNNAKIMLRQIEEFSQLGIKIAFDPGQQITSFNCSNLRKAIASSYFVLGNDYEISLMEKISKWTKKQMLKKTEVLVTTLGNKGSLIETSTNSIRVKANKVKVVDPTGAGDAYRAGFFVSYEKGLSLKECAESGSLLASYAVGTQGTQKYSINKKRP